METLTEAILRERWPCAFNDAREPLKRGIHRDMLLPEPNHPALRAWCSRQQYLFGMVEGRSRIDLDGRPCGIVSEIDQAAAEWELTAMGITIPRPLQPERLQAFFIREN